MRFVICVGLNASTAPLFKNLIVLPLTLLFHYELNGQTCALTQQQESSCNLSNDFMLSKYSYRTRSTTNEELQILLLRLQRIRKSIKFTCVKVCNCIPSNIKKFFFRNFKKLLKSYLLYSSD